MTIATLARIGPLALLLAGCAALTTTDDNPLVGTWMGRDGRAAGTSMVFRSNGEALWIMPDTFRLQYRHTQLGARHHIDLSGFAGGPLAGRTLYCVGQMPTEDALRLDCEPGTDQGVRPSTIDDAQVQVFRRE